MALFETLGVIRASDRATNAVGFVKEVEDDENRRSIKYMCYPGLRGVELDTPRWQIKRAITYYNEDGTIDYHTFDYPKGITDYCFRPDQAEDYDYKFANL